MRMGLDSDPGVQWVPPSYKHCLRFAKRIVFAFASPLPPFCWAWSHC